MAQLVPQLYDASVKMGHLASTLKVYKWNTFYNENV